MPTIPRILTTLSGDGGLNPSIANIPPISIPKPPDWIEESSIFFSIAGIILMISFIRRTKFRNNTFSTFGTVGNTDCPSMVNEEMGE